MINNPQVTRPNTQAANADVLGEEFENADDRDQDDRPRREYVDRNGLAKSNPADKPQTPK